MKGVRRDLRFQQFGRLYPIHIYTAKELGKDFNATYYYCLCECGNTCLPQRQSLTTGRTKSCGCLQKEAIAKVQLSHGHSLNHKKTPTYQKWLNMKMRCKPDSPKHKDYYDRGIKIEDARWLKFENFLEDMGICPNGLTLERVDNDKGYYKENCRWATRKEQSQNTRPNPGWFPNENMYNGGIK